MKKAGMMAFLLLFVLACFSPSFFQEAEAAKILSINFFSSKSHKIVYEPLLHALAERGHEVTIVGPVKGTKEMKNLRNILTLDLAELHKEIGMGNMFEMKLAGGSVMKYLMNPFLMFGGIMGKICRKSYALPVVQEIMKEKYDLIIFAPLFNECLYGLIHQFNTSTILISQVSIFPWVAASFGNPTPPSFVPNGFLGFGDKMTYIERVFNFLGNIYNYFALNYVFYPQMESTYRDVLGNPNLPSIQEIEKNASIALCNSHISFTEPKPLLPDIIDVGGMHMKSAKPVPKDLEDFFSGAGDDGFILFSMGSALQAHTMPERYRKLFLNAFAKLKQRVIWKWETEMDDLPKNVKISKWLPQQDVLGHKNCRLFITHGGHGSTQEAIFHGVPLVGIPMFADQNSNVEKAAKHGFAIPLEFNDLTEEILLEAINKVLTQSSYREKAKHLSALFHDQPDKALDRAVFWSEYVLRHKGAIHLRSAGRDLTVAQYYSLDVFAGIGAVLAIILYLDFIVLRALLRKCRGVSKSSGQAKDKKNQ